MLQWLPLLVLAGFGCGQVCDGSAVEEAYDKTYLVTCLCSGRLGNQVGNYVLQQLFF